MFRGKSMNSFKKFIFNSKTAATDETPDASSYNPDLDMGGDTDSQFQVLHDPDTNHAQIDVDPERGGGSTKRAAKNAAKHILKNYKAMGYTEPPAGRTDKYGMTDRDILGIFKNRKNGEWQYSSKMSRLANPRTLADYMVTPVIPKAWKRMPNVSKQMTLGDGVRQPHLHVGFDLEGNEVHAGQMADGRTADPLLHLGNAKALRDVLYGDLLENGKTDTKSFWEAAKQVAHFFHGRGATKADPLPEGSDARAKWHGLNPGEEPVKGHEHINTCVRNMAEHTEPAPGASNGVKDMHNDAKSAYFVLDNCPMCAIDRQDDVAKSVFDVQHHARIMDSPDKLIREGYFHPTAFHRGTVSEIGESLKSLGTVGALSPHRIVFGTDSMKKFVKTLAKRKKDKEERKQQEIPVPRSRADSRETGIDLGQADLSFYPFD